MAETWYVLEDGSYADPRDVVRDEAGKLHHKNGLAVAMRGDVPSTRSVDPDEERAKSKPRAKARESDESPATREVAPPADREMKAEGGRGYKTRDWKRRT